MNCDLKETIKLALTLGMSTEVKLFWVLALVLKSRRLTGWLNHVRQGREAVPNTSIP